MAIRARLILLSLFLFAVSISAIAQGARDYAITSARYEIIQDGSLVRVTVLVQNEGADALSDTTVTVTLLGDTPRVLVTDTLLPLESGASVTLEIPFDVTLFPVAQQTELEIAVGVDNFEPANTPIAENNTAVVTVDIPVQPDQTVIFERTADGVVLFGQYYSLVTIALATLAFVGFLLVFWLVTAFLRLIFSRPPRFDTWQPPYGVMPAYDQNTIEGRRWGWQQLAQNGLLLAPATEANIHPIKILTGSDGRPLNNWVVTGMRLSQYDIYGRIARTQVIASKQVLRKMNRILKKRDTLDEARLEKLLQPIARTLVKQFAGKIKQKTAFLPIAFDIRWEGTHGDVRIIFELYQFSGHVWNRIDQWDPIMQVVSQKIQENYTFTIHGQDGSEKKRDFQGRLRDDVIWLLYESLRLEPVPEPVSEQDVPSRKQYDIPDTLAGMQPVKPEDQPLPAKSDD